MMIKKIKSLNFLEVIGLLFAVYVIIRFVVFPVNAALDGWNNPF
ncbi:hypothetical protein RM549_17840 [Salegentibacter sp. F188]|uniref:Uncharacterized protein n=1 Tax=Autumnicola patrickiae TaxID=3075591 RepID=A0ABU3E6Q0_9FLAO|nr:hypothetical protein [Salegentibacter sp. F188]MDT0691659.1 hypothetical protein [Salegentibacter sp. F188]